MVSAKGLRPGDILTAASGKTVEVNNTGKSAALMGGGWMDWACFGWFRWMDCACLWLSNPHPPIQTNTNTNTNTHLMNPTLSCAQMPRGA